MRLPPRALIGILLLGLVMLSCNAPLAVTATPSLASLAAVSPSPTATLPTLAPTLTFSPQPTETAIPSLTPTITMTPEVTGCWLPPDDYERVQVNGWTLNRRTLAMLQHAAGIYQGVIDITGAAITQGSYTSDEPASFGTHDGGGAVDLSVMRPGTWTVASEDIEPLIHAMRVSGFAAWLRTYDELYPGSPIHIHAVAVGDRDLSPAAREQLTGAFGYFRGFTGVPIADGPPQPDRHGGPILCQWMIDLGYQDLRLSP